MIVQATIENRRTQGFTLVELLIAISVTTIMSVVVLGFMTDSIQSSSIATAKQSLLYDAQQGINAAASTIRLSANADINNRWPDDNAPTSGDPYSWQSSNSTLILATAAQNSARNIIFSDPSHYITEKNNIIYFVKNGVLYRRILASTASGNAAKTTCPANLANSSCPADQVVLRNVQTFSISYRDGSDAVVSPVEARSIILSTTLRTSKFGQRISASYTTRMVFRND